MFAIVYKIICFYAHTRANFGTAHALYKSVQHGAANQTSLFWFFDKGFTH